MAAPAAKSSDESEDCCRWWWWGLQEQGAASAGLAWASKQTPGPVKQGMGQDNSRLMGPDTAIPG